MSAFGPAATGNGATTTVADPPAVSGCVVDETFRLITSFGPGAEQLGHLLAGGRSHDASSEICRAVARCLDTGASTIGAVVRLDAPVSSATIDVHAERGREADRRRVVVTMVPSRVDPAPATSPTGPHDSVAAAMIHESPGMVFVLDAADRIVLVNPSAAEELDIDVSVVTLKSPAMAFASGDYRRDVLLSSNDAAMADGHAFVEIMRPVPETTLLRIDKFPFFHGGERFLGITARQTPISSLPRRREAARELQLLRLVDLMPAPIWVINAQRRIVRVNEAARSLATSTTSALIGSSVYTAYPATGTEVFGPADADFASLVTSGQPAPILSAQSNDLVFRIDRTLLPGAAGPASAMAVMLTDLSEVHGAQQELQMKNEVLEHRNAELDQFAHMASHDLRAPLRAIYAFTQMAMEEEGDEHRDHLGAILGSVDRMRSVLDSLLDYATADSNPVFDQVALSDVVTSVLGDLASDIAESGALVKVDELPVLQCDETSMRRLFQNLIANAISYAGDDAPSITITSTPEYRFVEIVVTDRGIGFPQDQEDDVFRPFKRLSPDSVGQGIGLSMCRRIVESHHGTIRAISQIGGPTSMVIRLPRRRTVWQ